MQDFAPKTVEETPTPADIRRRIYDARWRGGITRCELGRTANVPATFVRTIEHGDDASLSQFYAVIAALGVDDGTGGANVMV